MLDEIKAQIIKDSIRGICRKNSSFAFGVITRLLDTELCILTPSKTNKFSQAAFKFPLDSKEEFLECILDCVETVTNFPASLSALDIDPDGYILIIKNQETLLKKMHLLDTTDPQTMDPWCVAGMLFVEMNKNKIQGKNLCIIDTTSFGTKTLDAAIKFNYLSL